MMYYLHIITNINNSKVHYSILTVKLVMRMRQLAYYVC